MLVSISSSLSIFVLFLLFSDRVVSNLLPRTDKPKKEPDPDCTATNPSNGEFFDLRPLIRCESQKYWLLSRHSLTNRSDWPINGRDYGHNFTLNICEPVLSDYSDVIGVEDRTNVSAYYTDSTGN